MNPFFLAELRGSLEAAGRDPMTQVAEQYFLPLLGSADAASYACMWSTPLDCFPTDHALPLRPRNDGRESTVALQSLQPTADGFHFDKLNSLFDVLVIHCKALA